MHPPSSLSGLWRTAKINKHNPFNASNKHKQSLPDEGDLSILLLGSSSHRIKNRDLVSCDNEQAITKALTEGSRAGCSRFICNHTTIKINIFSCSFTANQHYMKESTWKKVSPQTFVGYMWDSLSDLTEKCKIRCSIVIMIHHKHHQNPHVFEWLQDVPGHSAQH